MWLNITSNTHDIQVKLEDASDELMANLQVMGESLTARDVVILLKTGYLFVFIITSRTDSIGYISYQCGECPI